VLGQQKIIMILGSNKFFSIDFIFQTNTQKLLLENISYRKFRSISSL